MIKQIISDINGVLYYKTKEGKVLTPYSKEFISYLNENEIPYILATNVTTETPNEITIGLEKLGLNVPANKVVTAIDNSISYLHQRRENKIFLVSDNEKLPAYFSRKDVDVCDNHVDAVVLGLDRTFNPNNIDKAIEFVNRGAELITLHRNLTRIDENGNKQPNVGTLVRLIEDATGKTAINVGKPSDMFYRQAIKALPSQDYSSTLVIGDDPVGDLSGAISLGMKTLLYRSAKCESGQGFEIGVDYETSNLRDILSYIK